MNQSQITLIIKRSQSKAARPRLCGRSRAPLWALQGATRSTARRRRASQGALPVRHRAAKLFAVASRVRIFSWSRTAPSSIAQRPARPSITHTRPAHPTLRRIAPQRTPPPLRRTACRGRAGGAEPEANRRPANRRRWRVVLNLAICVVLNLLKARNPGRPGKPQAETRFAVHGGLPGSQPKSGGNALPCGLPPLLRRM